MLDMTTVKVRGIKVRFYRENESVWLVAKDILKLFSIRKKLGYFYTSAFKQEIKKLEIGDSFITAISVQGVRKIQEDFPVEYSEELLIEVLDKIKNNKILPKKSHSEVVKRKLFGVVAEAKKKTHLTEHEIWSESYDLFSGYLGFDIRKKAKDMGMTIIGYIEYDKLLEEFYEFVKAVYID